MSGNERGAFRAVVRVAAKLYDPETRLTRPDEEHLTQMATRIWANTVSISHGWRWHAWHPPSVALNLGSQDAGVGLFTTMAMLNHSCSPNCHYSFDEAGRIVVTALCDIDEGANLYISYVSLYQPTPHRRAELSDMYFFDCACERCKSYGTGGTATLDADTVMTGLCCQNPDPCHGLVEQCLPSSDEAEDGDEDRDGDGALGDAGDGAGGGGGAGGEAEPTTTWECSVCGCPQSIRAHQLVCSILGGAQAEIRGMVEKGDVEGAMAELRKALGAAEGLLHPCHGLMHSGRVMLIGLAHLLGDDEVLATQAAEAERCLEQVALGAEFDLWCSMLCVKGDAAGCSIRAAGKAAGKAGMGGSGVDGGGSSGSGAEERVARAREHIRTHLGVEC